MTSLTSGKWLYVSQNTRKEKGILWEAQRMDLVRDHASVESKVVHEVNKPSRDEPAACTVCGFCQQSKGP
eukprot:scaffold14939_cov115-Isochrysis_galbana.AAC.1